MEDESLSLELFPFAMFVLGPLLITTPVNSHDP